MAAQRKKLGPARAAKSLAPGELSPTQEKAALGLARGLTQCEAGREAGVADRRIRHWLADVPAFAARVHELRREMSDRLVTLLTSTAADAMLSLDRLRRTATEPKDEERLSVKILEQFPPLRGVLLTETELRQLQAQVRELEKGTHR